MNNTMDASLRIASTLVMLFAIFVLSPLASATELVQLAPENWKQYAPGGKEVDCIYGDYVLCNDRITVVIAQPLPTRHANMTVRNVGGAIIDLTNRPPWLVTVRMDRPASNDQLSAFYPDAARYSLHSPDDVQVIAERDEETGIYRGETVKLQIAAQPKPGQPQYSVLYELADGQPYISVTSIYHNTSEKNIEITLSDSIRADRTFEFGTGQEGKLFWAEDDWFRQSYGIYSPDRRLKFTGRRGVVVEYLQDGQSTRTLSAGARFSWTRHVFPGDGLLNVQGVAAQQAGNPITTTEFRVSDPDGPVPHARIALKDSRGQPVGSGRTDDEGVYEAVVPHGEYSVEVTALGRPAATASLTVSGGRAELNVRMESCGYIMVHVSDSEGEPIPCKVSFHNTAGEEHNPYFGPDSAAPGSRNVRYSRNGRFQQEVPPGNYEVLISRGPEYDALTHRVSVQPGHTTWIEDRLVRSVDTRGWISADFHSHSSPSGDNTASQRGRVLNLLAEHIEFGPCTEHNRISSYLPHLKALEAEAFMATCTGIELTGSPLPVNHQNAFPLVHKPRTQDGGGPVTDVNPVVQIERLALWDDGSDKLVQGNHPNLVQIWRDKDLDGEADGGFENMFQYMDVMEVHPPAGILSPPTVDEGGRLSRNAIFHWMQMLNQGYWIPGVVNTDAHYNYHGSGWLRNYIKSDTDDPQEIETKDVVHASEAGQVMMSNGPFLEATLEVASNGASQRAVSGDTMEVPTGKARLQVRVQCSNWIDVNRVQVFLNGQPAEELNYNRRQHPGMFGKGVVRFEASLPLEVKADTHVIVAAAGEGLQLGRVMGPRAGQAMPIAVTNPIFMDVDGGGFQPNGDLLGVPLPSP